MGHVMKGYTIFFIFFFWVTNLSAQILYDTIPDNEVVFGDHGWEEMFIFKDFEQQGLSYYNKIDFRNLGCYGDTVFVSTIFSRNGELKNTRIVKSASPLCDSIAFNFVNGLHDWLPGITRGSFVDMPFSFPFIFDSIWIKNRYTKADHFFNATEEEFNKRKDFFDFFYSQSSQKIVNDFTYFYEYLAEKLGGDSLDLVCWEYDRPKKKNRVKIDLKNENTDSINFIIYYPDKPHIMHYILAKERWIIYWDKYKWRVTPNFNPTKKKGQIYLEKNKRLMLIGFVKGKEAPELALYNNIIFSNDTILNLDLKPYDKNDMLNKIKHGP